MKKNGNVNLILDVLKNNKRAIKFYNKNGFMKVGTTKFGDLPGIVMKRNKKQKGGWHSNIESFSSSLNKSSTQTGGWGEVMDDVNHLLYGGGENWSDMSNI